MPPVDDEAREFWLRSFSDDELASLASAVFKEPVAAETISANRLALAASGRILDAAAL